jgi:hypothetical protein
MFSQIKGETSIKMIPVGECGSRCTNKRVTLKAGEIRKYRGIHSFGCFYKLYIKFL